MHKILIIEDNAAIRDNTEELLELNGFEVFTTNNGHKGIELLEEHKIDLILCDIHMPEVSGFEVFRELKKNDSWKEISFIFISASVQHFEKAKALHMDIDGFIEKPFTEKKLTTTINSIINNNN